MKKISLLALICLIVLGLGLNCGKSPDETKIPEPETTPVAKAVETTEAPTAAPPAPRLAGNFEEFIPDNVYIYLSFDNIGKFTDSLKKSSFGKLWDDPEVKKFTEGFVEIMEEEFTKNVTKKTNITFDDITSLSEVFTGQAAFVLDSIELQNVKKKTKRPARDSRDQIIWDQETGELKYEEVEVEDIQPMPHLILMAQTGQNKEKLEALLDKIITSLAEEGTIKKKEDYKNVSYFTFYRQKESTKLSYGYMDNIFFVSFGEKALKRIVDNYRETTTTKALYTKAAYKKITTQSAEDRLATVYVNVPPFISMFKSFFIKGQISAKSHTPEELDNLNKTFDKIIDLCGLADLKSIVGTNKAGGNEFISEGMMEIPGAKRGIWSVIANNPTSEFKTVKAAPSDSMIYMAGTLSFTRLYDEVMNIIASVMPREEYENEVQVQLNQFEEQLGLKIKDGILSVFGNEIALIMNASEKTFSPDRMDSLFPFNMAIVIPIIKPDAAKQAHEQIMKVVNAGNQGKSVFTEKQYDGFTFYVMEPPYMDEEDMQNLPEDQREVMGYFLTNNFFVYTVPASNLKKIANAISGKDAGSLVNNPDYLKLIAQNKVADKGMFLYYANMEKYLENMYSMFTNLANMRSGAMIEFDDDSDEGGEENIIRPDMPQDKFAKLMKQLPKLDTIRKYFTGCRAVEQMYPTPDGIMWRSIMTTGKE